MVSALVGRPDLRIGALDDSTTNLTTIGDVVLNSAGRMFVAQPRENHIKVFTPSGERAGSIGRPGEGPGEIRQLFRIGWIGNDLYVLDAVERLGRRVHRFDSSGAVLSTRTVPATSFDSTARRAQVIGLLEGGARVVAPSWTTLEPDEERLPILLVDSGGAVLRQLSDVRRRRTMVYMEGASVSVGRSEMIEDAPIVVIAPDGKWVAVVDRYAATSPDTHAFTITRFSPAGSQEWQRRVEYTPQPLPEGLNESIIGTFLASGFFSRRGLSAAAARRLLVETIEPIDFYPPVLKARPGVDGTLWILPPPATSDRVTWDVFDAQGARRRSVELPRDFELRIASRDFVIGAEADSLDVPIVSRYVIQPGGEPRP